MGGVSQRIARIEAWPVNVPLDAPYEFALGVYRGMSRTILRVTTAEGVQGLGETMSPHDAALLAGELGETLVGRDVAELRTELGAPAPAVRTARRVDAGARSALAGVEVALWDVEAHAAGMPLHRLLGGPCRTEVPVSEYFAYRLPGPEAAGEATAPDVAAYCERMVAEHGSPVFEGKVSTRPVEEEVELVALVREAIGPDRELRLDANTGWRLETAREALTRLAASEIASVEEPVATAEEAAELRRTCPIPFSTHDPDLDRAVALGVPDTLVLDTAACGGVAGTLRFVAACEAAGKGFWFYSGHLGPATAVHLQLAAALPFLGRASQSLLRWYTDDVIEGGPFVPERGLIGVPDGPGLGVELDDAAVARGVERFAREGEYDLYGGPPPPRY
jgi:glucarate dehydratase